jgi:two-component system, sensor histidine kinase and response regulator
MRAWLLQLLSALRQPGDRFPVGDMRDLMIDVLGLIGVASVVMIVIGVAAVPTSTPAGMVVAVAMGLAPLMLRWVVQRAPINITVPAILLGTVAMGCLWIRAVGSLQAVQSALLLVPLIFATFIYGPKVGLISASGVSLLAFALAALLSDPQRRGSIPPFNQAWILTELAFITVLCVIGLHRYVARTHRGAVDARAQRQEDENLLSISHRLRMAVDAGQFGVWEYDAASDLFSIDAQQARLYAVAEDTRVVSFDQWRAAVHRSDRERASQEFQTVIRLGQPYDLTFRIRRADGAVRWLRSLGQPVRDVQGNVVRVVGLDRDVTEQEEGSRALREAGERLSMAVSAAGGVAWTVDGDSRRLQWNAPGLDVYGVHLLEHPDAWLEVVMPDDLARVAAAWREALADHAPEEFEFEFRIRHAQRGLRHIRCVGRCEHDAQGALLRAVGIDIDVSSQREAAARVSELSERLALAASASGMGTWQLDLKVGSIAWDERQAALYGLPAQICQVGPTQWSLWIEPEDRPALQAVLDGSAERMEWSLRPMGGQAMGRRVRTMAQTLRGAHGEALRRVGASFDITAEWRAQQAIERARAEAEQSSRAKSAFLANMSHEIRTPMNAVIGLTGLLLDSVGPGQAHQHAAKAHSAARGLLAVLNDVLDVSKIEAGKLDLERSRFALAEVFSLVHDTLAHEAQAKGLTLNIQLDPTLPTHWVGDRVRLNQILLNLASNAVKFTHRGTVSLRARAAGHGGLRCEVEDTGIGMDRATQGRIFDAFEQADATTTRHYGGTGLGLTISRHLVRLMGGELRLESTLGAGTVFWFELAEVRPIEQLADPASQTVPASLERLQGAQVLLVEDNELNRLVGEEMLRRLGAVPLLAASGAEALSVLRTHAVDAVLMDIQMPGMDGLETTQRIRALPGAAARVPVIAMTANAMAGDRERSLDAGMNDHVTKPIDRAALGAVLAQWLGPRPETLPDVAL